MQSVGAKGRLTAAEREDYAMAWAIEPVDDCAVVTMNTKKINVQILLLSQQLFRRRLGTKV